jgi:hypothetical protein
MYGEYKCGCLVCAGGLFAYDANASDGFRTAEEAAEVISRFRLYQCMAKVKGAFSPIVFNGEN